MDASSGEAYAVPGFIFRKPRLEDGAGIFTLVKNSKPLDANSLYSYLILTAHFGDTCIVVEQKSEIVGYISAYIHPGKKDTLFVWQVAVGEGVRQKGVGMSMLMQLLKRDCLASIRWLETTVTPSNGSSARLFHSLARKLNTSCHTSAFFPRDLFEGQSHEEEVLFRIGPFSKY
ncbi:MAG TPA: diaminobutyrate acetyltransferase [Deltaproteobacteria bacterium]|nr:diaminobutyrate acetyltransferase [Deltaproteobacteria bacterium]